MASLAESVFVLGALFLVTLTVSGCGEFTCSNDANVKCACTYTCQNGKSYTIDYLFQDNSCCSTLRAYFNETVCWGSTESVSDEMYCRVRNDCSDCTQSPAIQEVLKIGDTKKCNNGVAAQAAAALRSVVDASLVTKRMAQERLQKIQTAVTQQNVTPLEKVLV